MTSRFASARAGVAMSLIIAATATGCSVGDEPSAAEPGPRYEQIPRDLCDQVEFEAVAGRLDLTVPPFPEHDSRYEVRRNLWYESCWFDAQATDDRFEPEGLRFDPHGPVSVEVYHEVADAKEAYEEELGRSFEYRAEQDSGATTAELAGWWDSGISLQWLRVPISAIGDPEQPANLVVAHLVRHDNLVVEAVLSTLSAPTKDVAGALQLLHDLAAALINEVVDHLTLAD